MVSRTHRIVPSGRRCPNRAFSVIMLGIVVKAVRGPCPPPWPPPRKGSVCVRVAVGRHWWRE